MSRNPQPSKVALRLLRRTALRPRLALVLGSGFQRLLPSLQADKTVPFDRIPGFALPSVAGHMGKFLLGSLGNVPLAVLSGRIHYYEGYSMWEVTLPIRVLAEMGVESVLFTNAAGGIHRRLVPGDFMLIKDHINLMGVNPLRGPETLGRPRFVDLTTPYDPKLRSLLSRAARQMGISLPSGVYAAVAGPSYETPAEIRGLARLGADAVGMSTVPEVIVARQCGLRVAGLSLITNRGAGLGGKSLSHKEVLRTAERREKTAAELLQNFVSRYAVDR